MSQGLAQAAPSRTLSLPAAVPATLRAAALIAACCAFAVLVGVFAQFGNRPLIVGVLTIGHALFAGIALSVGATLVRRAPNRAAMVPAAFVSGALGGAALLALIVAARAGNIRWIFVSLTPQSMNRVTFALPDDQALLLLAGAGAVAAGIGGLLAAAPAALRRPVIGVLVGIVVAGLLRELIRSILGGFAGVDSWGFDYDGLLPPGAAAAGALGALVAIRPGAAYARLPARLRSLGTAACFLLLLALPMLTNDFVAQVMLLVCLYTLMGLGLNVELGLAGLVDLGFVAFFAVGAYTVALLTADHDGAGGHLGFFAALPLAILAASAFGFLFGLPVLKVRGDYLAIATLGLGEIIRVLVLSDMLKPWLGGAQGIVNIPKPVLFGLVLSSPTRLFYMAAALTAVAGYFAWRLQHSGLGRRWLAVREDEDVAQALGIALVRVKLSAYTTGAAFAGLAGGIFAGMVGSVFPQSFQLLVSVNVLAILVVGGIGSLPGVAIGAAALIGAPEVLRDLGEFRYLIYGLVIIAVVRLKPDGLSPKAIRHREAL